MNDHPAPRKVLDVGTADATVSGVFVLQEILQRDDVICPGHQPSRDNLA
jgi:hypothetical protein